MKHFPVHNYETGKRYIGCGCGAMYLFETIGDEYARSEWYKCHMEVVRVREGPEKEEGFRYPSVVAFP